MVLIGGRNIIDDYYETEARAVGKKEGETIEAANDVEGSRPSAVDRRKEVELVRDRSRRKPDAFSFNNNDLYGNPTVTIFGDSGATPFERARGWNMKRASLQRLDINEENWMLEMAKMVKGMNSELAENRKERLQAFPRPYEAIDEDEDDQKECDERGSDEGDLTMENVDEEGAINDDESTELKKMEFCAVTVSKGNDKATREAKRQEYLVRKKQARPVGIFEPVSQMPHIASSTQPSRAWTEQVSMRPRICDSEETNSNALSLPLLGGAKVGGQGWGIATFDHAVVLPKVLSKGLQNIVVPQGQWEEP